MIFGVRVPSRGLRMVARQPGHFIRITQQIIEIYVENVGQHLSDLEVRVPDTALILRDCLLIKT